MVYISHFPSSRPIAAEGGRPAGVVCGVTRQYLRAHSFWLI